MISPGDTMAASLWRAHLGYANTSCLEPKRTVSLSLLRPTSSVETPLPDDGNGSDPSELPYLDTEPVETKELEYASPTIDSLDSGIDSALLMAMLSGEDTEVEGIERSIHSRPMLYINPVSVVGNNVLSAPSPIDSGYGSRPDTPSVGMCGYGSDESTWSPVDDTSSISDESSNTHMLPEGFSDAKYWNHVTDAKTSPASQGPVIPRIVLSDEEGRVLEATIDDQFGVFSSFDPSTTNEDADSPYGGLMSLTALEKTEPAFPVSCFSSAPQVRSSATGAVLDRAFVSLIRTQTPLSATISIYHNRHRAPTFVLDCVGEEEEEEEEQRYEVAEERGRVGEGCMFFTLEEEGRVESEVDVGRVRCRTDEVCSVAQDSISYHDAESLLQPVGSPGKREFNTWHFEDGEDDECEECGLFLTEPDDKYYNLFDGLSRLPTEPTVMFGLLKAATRVRPNELNTAYHMAVQGCTLRTCSAPCLYNCERGYWGNSGGISSIACPLDCPAHGGRDVCKVDAIFRRSTLPSRSTAEPDCAGPDYQTFAAEVVGLAPLERKSAEEDLDDSDLVLHSGEKFRPTESKNTPPNAGASYDEYMSHFMDDVDLSGSSSNDNSRTAPFGKFVGGALKDMTVPEAVDHLKEGLERTESAFRAALTAPFRFNSVADRLTQHLKSGDPKVHPPKERRGSNAFRHHRKESSASGIKTKWSNMLNKFTR